MPLLATFLLRRVIGLISILGLALPSALVAAPLNDHFANRTVLSGPYADASGTTVGATVEPGEPNPPFDGRTVWWTWTAPASGRVELRGDFTHLTAFYTGGALNSLTLVTNGFNPSFNATRGTTYQLQIKPWSGSPGPFSFSLALITVELTTPTNFANFRAPASFDIEAMPLALDTSFASVTFLENDTAIGTVTTAPWRLRRVDLPVGYRTYRATATDLNGITTTSAPVVVVITPPHDDFANRIRLTGASVTLPTTVAPATSEPGEPLLYTNAHRVWYSWTAPHSGLARVWTESPQQLLQDLFRGDTLQTLTRVATDHAGLFRIEQGQSYHIALAGWFFIEDALPVQTTLRIEAYHLSANENFASRLPLPGNSVTVPASNFTFAALEPGEPRHVRYGAGRSVWWTWTAPENGAVSIRTTGNAFTTALAAYAGTSLATLTELAAGAYDPVGFYAFAGSNYQIAVDVYAGDPDFGFFNLHLDFTPMPRAPNDDFANRIRLGTGTINGSNAAATREPGEPLHCTYPGQRSVWYAWTSPGFGALQVFVSDVAFSPLVAVYTGSSLAALTPVNGSECRFQLLVQPGVEYQIAVDGMFGGNGPFQLALQYLPPPDNDNFANRIPIHGFPVTQQGSNALATAEPGEPRHAPSPFFNFAHSVWYTWTAPVDGLVTAHVSMPPEQAGYWKIVGVYTGTAVDALTLVVNGAANVTWQAQQGVVYQIAVDGHPSYALFTLRLLGPPPNNNFADRIPLTGPRNLLTASNVGATLEPFEPRISTNDPGGRSVWWTWTAPEDGEAELRAGPIDYESALLGIYSGTTLDSLSLLARSRNGRLRFFVRAGATYQIQVDGSFGRSAEFGLLLHLLPPARPLSFDLPNVRRLPDGRVQLPIFGRLDDYIFLEASSDLQTWQEVDRDELEASSGLFIDTPPPNLPRRFYRLRNWSAGDGF